jgi:uncharacterized protein Yka (UPF0111/DUF47 family)
MESREGEILQRLEQLEAAVLEIRERLNARAHSDEERRELGRRMMEQARQAEAASHALHSLADKVHAEFESVERKVDEVHRTERAARPASGDRHD